jgi:hypothetical protein
MVQPTPASAWEPAQPNQALGLGATVRTADEETEMRLADGTVATVGASSTVQVQIPTEIASEQGGIVRASRLDLKGGELRLRAAPGATAPVLVVGPDNRLVTLRAGTVHMTLAQGALAVNVHDGAARVASQGRWVALDRGSFIVVRASGRMEPARPLPAAPAFTPTPCEASSARGCSIALVTGEEASALGVRWEPLPGAARYLVTLARDAQMNDVVTSAKLGGDAAGWTTAPLRAGAYWVAVRARLAGGVETQVSAPRPLRVVRLAIDSGATFVARDSVVVLPPGRAVRLEDPSGLEARLAGKAFLPAPGAFTVRAGDPPSEIGLRLRGDDAGVVSLRLEARKLRAEVDLAPLRARWPEDPVLVSVRLSDPSRRLDVSELEPRLYVRVNDKPELVRWRHVGGAWAAMIPPKQGSGPWVVRVEVRDTDGNPLGHGALEVVSRAGLPSGIGRPLLW